jgi:hypothetical protein
MRDRQGTAGSSESASERISYVGMTVVSAAEVQQWGNHPSDQGVIESL